MKRQEQSVIGLGLMLLMLTRCVPETQPAYAPPTWNGITPGVTSSEEVETLMGSPARVDTAADGRIIYIYPNSRGDINDPHAVFIDEACDCVVEAREVIAKDFSFSFVLQDILDKYGEPEAVLGTNYWLRSSTFIYATRGLAFTAQSTEEVALCNVLEVRYFLPMTMEEFLKTPFGSNLPAWVPPQWVKYQYTPLEDDR